MHEDPTRAINFLIQDPKNIPMWLTFGITFLLSTGKDKKRTQKNNAQLLAYPQYITFLWLC